MIALLLAAFTMGMLGSFHCVGMCGPLALSLPLNNDSNWARFSGALLYNLGRVVTYATFGLAFGIIGNSVAFFGYQQWLSILLGTIIILLVILPKRFSKFSNNNIAIALFQKLRTALSKLFTQKKYSSLFTIGLLNGLLPCGLVYMAAAGAVATGDIVKSIIFMALFGLGTLPMIWGIAFWGNYVSINIRQKIRKAYPYMMVIMACLLIVRGMGLGIKYVSPKMSIEKKAVTNCCSNHAELK
jgi:uncharacterized protein